MTTVDLDASSAGANITLRTLEASSPRYGEKLIKAVLFACAVLSVLVTTAIVISLLTPAISFFQEVSVIEFLTGTEWSPGIGAGSFGVLPIVIGTLTVVFYAMLVAIPVGLASAIYLSEYASNRVRKVIKPALEVLEGIPTVATGMFAFYFLRPAAESALPFIEWKSVFSIGVAGVAVGLLIVPLVASISDDAMRSVPAGLREGAYALGASKLTVSLRVVLPAAISGIIAGIVLGMSRAIGETMVVLIVAGGGNPKINFNPGEGSQAMTSYIGIKATGDIPQGTLVYDTIFAVGALLFVMTLAMNVLAIRMVRRFREVYE